MNQTDLFLLLFLESHLAEITDQRKAWKPGRVGLSWVRALPWEGPGRAAVWELAGCWNLVFDALRLVLHLPPLAVPCGQKPTAVCKGHSFHRQKIRKINKKPATSFLFAPWFDRGRLTIRAAHDLPSSQSVLGEPVAGLQVGGAAGRQGAWRGESGVQCTQQHLHRPRAGDSRDALLLLFLFFAAVDSTGAHTPVRRTL